jgi:hypothetical protein
MIKTFPLTIFSFLFFLFVQGQSKKEVFAYFDMIKPILSTEKLGNNLVYRLDTLKSNFIPSRSHLNDYFNREIDFGFKHRRITLSLNFAEYQIDVLCKNDTIYLSSITSPNYKKVNYDNYNKEQIEQFLNQRNNFYNSSKTTIQLIEELSLPEIYAFRCGDGNPKTKKGKFIEQLVDQENINILAELLNSFNCETQAYAVAGLEMLENREYKITNDIQNLIFHVKKRNSELITCSGCLTGIVGQIYPRE